MRLPALILSLFLVGCTVRSQYAFLFEPAERSVRETKLDDAKARLKGLGDTSTILGIRQETAAAIECLESYSNLQVIGPEKVDAWLKVRAQGWAQNDLVQRVVALGARCVDRCGYAQGQFATALERETGARYLVLCKQEIVLLEERRNGGSLKLTLDRAEKACAQNQFIECLTELGSLRLLGKDPREDQLRKTYAESLGRAASFLARADVQRLERHLQAADARMSSLYNSHADHQPEGAQELHRLYEEQNDLRAQLAQLRSQTGL